MLICSYGSDKITGAGVEAPASLNTASLKRSNAMSLADSICAPEEKLPHQKRTDLKPTAKCEACGADFYASPGHIAKGWGRACGFSCRAVLRKNKSGVKCKCRRCGSLFRQKPSLAKSGHGKSFCSAECRRESTNEVNVCQHCGVRFTKPKSQCRNRRWCSIACKLKAIKPKNNCICITCGERFYCKSVTSPLRKKGMGSFCSMRCKAMFMSSSHVTTGGSSRGHRRYKGGKRADLGDCYFRSGWEANWARYLNWLVTGGEIKAWEYESETFEFPVKRGSKIYTPDFKITANDGSVLFHEVKGWMNKESAQKLKRMRIYHPTVNIVLVQAKQYHAVSKTVAAKIENWE